LQGRQWCPAVSRVPRRCHDDVIPPDRHRLPPLIPDPCSGTCGVFFWCQLLAITEGGWVGSSSQSGRMAGAARHLQGFVRVVAIPLWPPTRRHGWCQSFVIVPPSGRRHPALILSRQVGGLSLIPFLPMSALLILTAPRGLGSFAGGALSPVAAARGVRHRGSRSFSLVLADRRRSSTRSLAAPLALKPPHQSFPD